MASRRASCGDGQEVHLRGRASPQRRASDDLAPWPCPKTQRGERTGRIAFGSGLQPPKTARNDLRRTQPCLSPRQVSPMPVSPSRPVSPSLGSKARLSRTNSPAVLRQAAPFATLLPRRNTEAIKTTQRSSNGTGTPGTKAPVLRGLDVEAVSGPPLHKRSRPGDAPEQYLTPRGTCPVRFTTLAEARWAFKERVGAVERALEFTATMSERLEGIKDHLASRSTSCGSYSDLPSELDSLEQTAASRVSRISTSS